MKCCSTNYRVCSNGILLLVVWTISTKALTQSSETWPEPHINFDLKTRILEIKCTIPKSNSAKCSTDVTKKLIYMRGRDAGVKSINMNA